MRLMLPSGIGQSQHAPVLELVTCDEDRDELFRLRHEAYVAAGFIAPGHGHGRFVDTFDIEPSTVTLVASRGGRARGGLRLSVSRSIEDADQLPCGDLEDVRRLRRQRRGVIAELSRLVVAPSAGDMFHRTSLTATLVRAGLLACRAADVDTVLIASRPQLAAFYRAAMGFIAISKPVRYPAGPGDEPVVLMEADLERAFERHARPFFRLGSYEVRRLSRLMPELLSHPCGVPARDPRVAAALAATASGSERLAALVTPA